ncbi:hypothetical protein PI124_g11619 [Phytophthora idaei]|nr:hypothetical protein PI125_g12182 [Phytophthora idaei]KAG3150939.1 hypothetical protein PI126_g11216 [Phytophthora idaei]KAG3243548.1 hypothetical protein PI124_g11619 [Phytophthora idaei]
MVLLSLQCAIVGQVESLFDVEIDDGAKVSKLKKAIKEEKKNDLKDVDADKLQLFLAKKHGAWLDGAGAAAVRSTLVVVNGNITSVMDGLYICGDKR